MASALVPAPRSPGSGSHTSAPRDCSRRASSAARFIRLAAKQGKEIVYAQPPVAWGTGQRPSATGGRVREGEAPAEPLRLSTGGRGSRRASTIIPHEAFDPTASRQGTIVQEIRQQLP